MWRYSEHNHTPFEFSKMYYFFLLFIDCLEPNVGYPGNDIVMEPRDSMMKCLAFCRQTFKCKVFVWHKTNKKCWLKTKRGEPVIKNNIISGPTCGKYRS